MKLLLTIAFALNLLGAMAQPNWYKPGNGFNSSFQNCTSGNYKGSLQGVLVLCTPNNDTLLYTFNNQSASL